MRLISYNHIRSKLVTTIRRGFSLAYSLIVLYLIFSVMNDHVPLENSGDVTSLAILTGVGIFVLLIVWIINAEQILEILDRERFTTYYQVGVLRFSRKYYSGSVEVSLEQDKERYFCIRLKTPGNDPVVLDRIPTKKQADDRLDQVKQLFR